MQEQQSFLERNNKASININSKFSKIITSDYNMYKVFNIIERVAETKSTVLVLGESGTGKELIAKLVHEISGVSGNFVPVNCGAIPDNLLESELFGYEKGAFTGAMNTKPGRFVIADRGTIFLDEIGDMSPHLQVKLLRVLQDGMVEPVGGIKPKPVNVRIIAATNVDLRKKVSEGKFREDLFYRLQVVPLELPPLRARENDIKLLLEFFTTKYCNLLQRERVDFSEEVINVFINYSWPGNVREFENLVQRLILLSEGDLVSIEDLPIHLVDQTEEIKDSSIVNGRLPMGGIDFNKIVDQFENNLITQALERTRGNKKAAAELLSLNRTTLVEKIKKKKLCLSEQIEILEE